MNWLSLGSAWFAFSLLAIIAMYILKKRYTSKKISSHLLWQQVLQQQEANRPWQKIKSKWLLWLQLLVAFLTVLALMQPVIQRSLSASSHMIMVLDRSASMAGHTNEKLNSFERAKQDMIDWLDTNWNGNETTILVNGDYPTFITNRERNKHTIIDKIKELQPYYGISEDDTTVSLARALHTPAEETVIYYYVDQYFKIKEQDQHTVAGTLTEHWNVYGEPSAKDESIRSFMLSQEGDLVRADATVISPVGMSKTVDLRLTGYDAHGKELWFDKKNEPASDTGITLVSFNGVPKASFYAIELASNPQDVNLDNNVEYGVVALDQQMDILLVSEGNLFIEKSLQLMNVNVIKYSLSAEVPDAKQLEHVKFIIVDGEYSKLEQQANWKQLLEAFPLWIIDHPTNAEAAILKNEPPVIEDHQVTQYFSMEDTYISKIKSMQAVEIGIHDVIVLYGGQPAIVASANDGKPYLRYLFSLQASDLSLRATFPILMMNSVEFMLEGSQLDIGQIIVQSTPMITISSNTHRVQWKLVKHWNEAIEHLVKQGWESEPSLYDEVITSPAVPGVYQFIEQDDAGNILKERMAIVASDRTEYAASSHIQSIVQLAENETAATGNEAVVVHWQSLIPYVALFILLIMLLEWEVYRRGI